MRAYHIQLKPDAADALITATAHGGLSSHNIRYLMTDTDMQSNLGDSKYQTSLTVDVVVSSKNLRSSDPQEPRCLSL